MNGTMILVGVEWRPFAVKCNIGVGVGVGADIKSNQVSNTQVNLPFDSIRRSTGSGSSGHKPIGTSCAQPILRSACNEMHQVLKSSRFVYYKRTMYIVCVNARTAMQAYLQARSAASPLRPPS
mmetsp:Transcript_18899/g.52540  ORF Transcript_18899/g.52540 Transcript_18899/m.52540 type:complete len:123 (-) Transcript_18899:708-1076(-)